MKSLDCFGQAHDVLPQAYQLVPSPLPAAVPLLGILPAMLHRPASDLLMLGHIGCWLKNMCHLLVLQIRPSG